MTPTNKSEILTDVRIKGIPISPGIAFSKVCLFNEGRHNKMPVYNISWKNIKKEKERYIKAAAEVKEKLDYLIVSIKNKLGKAEAEIFTAQKMILDDSSLGKKVMKEIEDSLVNAEAAIVRILESYETRLQEVDDHYFKDRATDFGELKRRLLDTLGNMNPSLICSGEEHCQKGKNRIIVADELTPSLTLELDTESTQGFVTEKGGAASHAAILARSLGIPAVSGIAIRKESIFCGMEILINGHTGEVILSPSEEVLSGYPEINTAKKLPLIVHPMEELTVLANLNLAKDVEDVLKAEADGIGLYRTEFEFLSVGRPLNEQEQLKRYTSVLVSMKDKPVYFRLLDIGGDKNAPFFKLPKEENPYLGFRGSRFLLGRPDLFVPQARALARASSIAPVHVMYPMVIDLEQFKELRQKFIDNTRDISKGKIYHGVMLEVPSACFQAKEIMEEADFASIGTNDLIQYFFAVDRNNALVAYDFHPDRNPFWELIQIVIKGAQCNGKKISVCGEITSKPELVKKLMALGINTVSVSPKLIGSLRQNIGESIFHPPLSQ